MSKKTLYFTLTNTRCKVEGKMKVLLKMMEAKELQVRHPSAFFIRQYMPPGWNGYMHVVTERGYFQIGHLPMLIKWATDNGHSYKYIDNRPELVINNVPKKVGNLKPRPYQMDAVKSVVNQDINGLHFPIGVLDCATNAGKTLMMAMVHLSIKDARTVMLINDGDLYEQFKRELPELLGKENVGFVRAKEEDWKQFTVCMVQTLSKNIAKFKPQLIKANVALVDEADLADNKTYKTIMKHMYNTSCRVGLSGTIYMSKLAKHKLKNQNLKAFFSEITYKITKKEMVEKGHSTNLVIKIVPGNTKQYKGETRDWQEVYDELITNNLARHKVILRRLQYNINYDRLPALVICRYHEHIQQVYEVIQKKLGKKYKIAIVHGGIKTKERNQIIQDFREGKIDILIGSYILRRGKNFPLIRYICQASGSDSNETISQIMGRGERKHKSKSKVVIDDIFDKGKYIERHSKHRISYYKKEGFRVIKLVK